MYYFEHGQPMWDILHMDHRCTTFSIIYFYKQFKYNFLLLPFKRCRGSTRCLDLLTWSICLKTQLFSFYFQFRMSKGLHTGPYKRPQTAALRQAKFYLPRQAAAPQRLIYCSNIYISAMAAVDQPH